MSASLGKVRALGDAPLSGRRLMRFIYLDEGGISKHEKSAIVCGVVVHGDLELIPLEEELDAIVRKHIPEEDQEDFVLHAAEIWAGTKYFKDREKWPWHRRAAILDDIVTLPTKLRLRIVFGWMMKSLIKVPEMARDLERKELDLAAHVICFVNCMMMSEELMRGSYKEEVAQIIAEDNDSARQTIKESLVLLKNPERLGDIGYQSVPLPLTRIRNPILFAKKRESKPLQLADCCTFLIRRRLELSDPRCWRFYRRLLPRMTSVLHADAPFVNQWPFGPSIVFQARA